MTKKDYILIAEAIKAAYLDAVSRQSVVAELGVKLVDQYPRFNYDAFKRACGVSDTPYTDEWEPYKRAMEELERYGR